MEGERGLGPGPEALGGAEGLRHRIRDLTLQPEGPVEKVGNIEGQGRDAFVELVHDVLGVRGEEGGDELDELLGLEVVDAVVGLGDEELDERVQVPLVALCSQSFLRGGRKMAYVGTGCGALAQEVAQARRLLRVLGHGGQPIAELAKGPQRVILTPLHAKLGFLIR